MMTTMDIYMFLAGVNIVISYLILQEFKIANKKEACRFNVKDLIDRIDKIVPRDTE